MTAGREFGAPRDAGFQQLQVVHIACDGPDWRKGEGPCRAISAVSAVSGRKIARARGWTVGVKNPGGKPRDFCPDHRPTDREIGDQS